MILQLFVYSVSANRGCNWKANTFFFKIIPDSILTRKPKADAFILTTRYNVNILQSKGLNNNNSWLQECTITMYSGTCQCEHSHSHSRHVTVRQYVGRTAMTVPTVVYYWPFNGIMYASTLHNSHISIMAIAHLEQIDVSILWFITVSHCMMDS